MKTKLVLLVCCLIGISYFATKMQAQCNANSSYRMDFNTIGRTLQTEKEIGESKSNLSDFGHRRLVKKPVSTNVGQKKAENLQTATSRMERLMEINGVQRYLPTGQIYYSSYGDLYDWELYFDGLALDYFGGENYTLGGLRVFLENEQKDGFIPRHIHKQGPPKKDINDSLYIYESKELAKPFLSQIALNIARMRGNISWLSLKDFEKLKRFDNYWLTVWDRNHNGLSEWASAPQSGCDTQLDRVGPWKSYFCEGVDLNSYLYMECLAISKLADALGQTKDASYFIKQANRKKKLIQTLLWDKKDSFFYSRDRRTGRLIKIKSAEGFLPLWAGIATPEQARLLVDRHLKNPAEFWTPYPIPSYARSEPHYTQYFKPGPGIPSCYDVLEGHSNWNGGVWGHWNYMIVHGLENYGFHKVAHQIAQVMAKDVLSKSNFFEYYNAETGKGMGAHPFWAGATLLLAWLPTELDLHLDPGAIHSVSDRLDFRTFREKLGIHGLFKPTKIHSGEPTFEQGN